MSDTVGGFGGILDASTGKRIAAPEGKTGEAMNRWARKNIQSTMHLSSSQKMAAQHGVTCYIYNVSPVFEHPRRADGFGTFLIPRAPKVGSMIFDKETGHTRKATAEDISGPYRLSAPIVINHSYIRSFPGMNEGKRVPYIEYGEDIAEDLVGCSEKYPLDLTSEKDEYSKNLKKWGVFITYGKPFEELSKAEQEALYSEAMQNHNARCIEKVNKGDVLFEQYKMRGKGGPLKIHRECALYLGQVIGPEYTDRAWVTARGGTETMTGKVDCPFCGSKIKATIAVCPNCKNIVDPDKYEKLSRRSKKTEKVGE